MMSSNPSQPSRSAIPLRFEFSKMIHEIESMERLSKRFIDKTSAKLFLENKKSLETIKTKGVVAHWKTSLPFRTNVSDSYEPNGRKCKHRVYGEVDWVWQIAPVVANNKLFDVVGNASMRTTIYDSQGCSDTGSPKVIAMWRTEIGAKDSPGCYFHQQVLGQDDNIPFPKSLSVPRLPSLLITPMAVLEFVIGELFQDGWSAHAIKNAAGLDFWKACQSRYLKQLLNWKIQEINRCTCSPWLALKLAKPMASDQMFLEEKHK